MTATVIISDGNEESVRLANRIARHGGEEVAIVRFVLSEPIERAPNL